MRRGLKVISLLMLVMVMGLTACSSGSKNGSSGESGGKVDLSMTIWGSEDEKKIYQERLDIVKQTYPDINVKLNVVAGDYDQKVQTMIAGGTPPDIMMLAENYQVYASKGQIIPLDDYIDPTRSTWTSAIRRDIANLMKYDGKQYGMPDRAGAMVVYYNKDMFDTANVPYPKKGWTREDFLEAAQKLTIKENGKIVQWGYYPSSWWPQWMQLIYQNGGSLFDESGQADVRYAGSAGSAAVFQRFDLQIRGSPTPTEVADMRNIGPDPMFAQGQIAMETTGFWNIGSLAKVEGINWDIAPVWGDQRVLQRARDHEGFEAQGRGVPGDRGLDPAGSADSDRQERPGCTGNQTGPEQRRVPQRRIRRQKNQHGRIQRVGNLRYPVEPEMERNAKGHRRQTVHVLQQRCNAG